MVTLIQKNKTKNIKPENQVLRIITYDLEYLILLTHTTRQKVLSLKKNILYFTLHEMKNLINY